MAKTVICSIVGCENRVGGKSIMAMHQTGLTEVPYPVCDSCYQKHSDWVYLCDVEIRTIGKEEE